MHILSGEWSCIAHKFGDMRILIPKYFRLHFWHQLLDLELLRPVPMNPSRFYLRTIG
jgi:hypothetical protein